MSTNYFLYIRRVSVDGVATEGSVYPAPPDPLSSRGRCCPPPKRDTTAALYNRSRTPNNTRDSKDGIIRNRLDG